MQLFLKAKLFQRYTSIMLFALLCFPPVSNPFAAISAESQKTNATQLPRENESPRETQNQLAEVLEKGVHAQSRRRVCNGLWTECKKAPTRAAKRNAVAALTSQQSRLASIRQFQALPFFHFHRDNGIGCPLLS